jgi:hypothetical protein
MPYALCNKTSIGLLTPPIFGGFLAGRRKQYARHANALKQPVTLLAKQWLGRYLDQDPKFG